MDRTQWLEWRRGSIGASDAVVLLFGSKWRSPHDILSAKRGAVPEVESDDTRRGHLYEPLALAAWERDHGRKVLRGEADLLHRPDNMYVHASLDGFVDADFVGDPLVLEVKSPRSARARDTEHDGPDPAWIAQVQYQLAVLSLCDTQADGGSVLVWHPEEARYHVHDVPWGHAERTTALGWVEYCDEWYRRHVLDGEPLPAETPVTLPRHELDADLTGTGDGRAVEWYVSACAALKAAEADRDAAAAALAEVAEAHRARRLVSGGVRITRIVNSGRRITDYTRARDEHPEIDWANYERLGAEYVTWRVSGGAR